MIEHINTASNRQYQVQKAQPSETRKVLRWVVNERMGGRIPVWETVSTAKQDVEHNLNMAKNGQNKKAEQKPQDFKTALSYQNTNTPHNTPLYAEQEEFGFGDLFDMVNPLHHIPIVGHLYRNITGDEIRPISQIIGGAVFGGGLGAASSLVNVIVEEETGKDLAGNTVAFLTEGKIPQLKEMRMALADQESSNQYKRAAAINSEEDSPEHQLNMAAQTAKDSAFKGSQYGDLPAALLAFTDTSHASGFRSERISMASGRTAGHIMRTAYPKEELSDLPPREPITQFSMRRMI